MSTRKILSGRVTWFLVGSALSVLIVHFWSTLSKLPKDFSGWATILSVAVVIVIYYHEQRAKKITAARLVLKEIETVLPLVEDFIEKRKYDLKTVGVATEHWRNQSHLFMTDMTQDEVNQIEKIYSCGRYIQKHMEQTDEYKRRRYEEIYQVERVKPENKDKSSEVVFNSQTISSERNNVNSVADALVSTFSQEAAKEIKDARKWTGYDKLRHIAKLK